MQAQSALEAIDRESLGDGVYTRLCDALVKGRFAPDTRLTIRDLAQHLGTSVTPVRDAILRLVQDGALEQRGFRDLRVPVISVAQYSEIRNIRVRLEGLAARECARRATQADIDRLAGLVESNERAIRERNWTQALELNQTFHFALAEIAGLTVLSGILNGLWLRMGPLIAEAYEHGGRQMIDHHHAVLDAVRRHDPDAAEAAIAADITDAGALIASRLAARTQAQP